MLQFVATHFGRLRHPKKYSEFSNGILPKVAETIQVKDL